MAAGTNKQTARKVQNRVGRALLAVDAARSAMHEFGAEAARSTHYDLLLAALTETIVQLNNAHTQARWVGEIREKAQRR